MTEAPDPGSAKPGRRDVLRVTILGAAAGGGALAVWPFLAQLKPSADVVATWIDCDLGRVSPGSQVVLSHRGRPLFIRHRTAAEIASATGADTLPLPDPQPDRDRVQRAEWLIVDGACTVDRCVTLFDQGDFGGWACPCCGAQYDTSGRARKGPPSRADRRLRNLTVPDYRFLDSQRVRFT